MNRCVFFIESKHPEKIPEDQKYDGLRFTVCGHPAEFMVNGSSYCEEHVAMALGRTVIRTGKTL